MREIDLNNQQTLAVPKKDSKSRYFFTNYVKNLDSTILLDLFNRISYDDETNVIYHVVAELEENRLDKIAFQYYNDSSYYWLIAMANNMIDPFVLVKGTVLKIPTLNSFMLKGINNGQ